MKEIGFDPSARGISRRTLLRWLALWTAAGAVAACGGGDSSDGDSGAPDGEALEPHSAPGRGVAGTPVSAAQRNATFENLEARLAAATDLASGRVASGRLLEWMAQQDVFQTIGYSATRNVYAIFTDGRALVVGTNIRYDAQGVQPAARAAAAALRIEHKTTARAAGNDWEAGIPSRQFRHLNTWNTNGTFNWPANVWARGDVADMSDLDFVATYMQDNGYQKIDLGDDPTESGRPRALTVEGLKSVQGDGVFFWSTHGGTLDPGGNIIQGLMTATSAYQSTIEDRYADEFADGTLIYYTGPLCLHALECHSSFGDGVNATRLAITPAFIRKYRWRFAEHSLVFVNACASASGEMKQAFLDAGASLFLGWTKPVRVWAMCGAAMDFFSLMLGLNENFGDADPNKRIEPRQRPYSWEAVIQLMRNHTDASQYVDEEEGYVELEATRNLNVPIGFLALRPSIYWTNFIEATSQFHLIGGMYGTRPGSAAIGSNVRCPGTAGQCDDFGSTYADWPLHDPTPLGVVSWLSENVVLNVPRDGVGSAGLVQLAVDGRFSNGVQLTRVNLPVRALKTYGGSLAVEITADLSFRGDFRGVRLEPDAETLNWLPHIVCTTPPTATLRWAASGRYSRADGQTTTVVEWSGSGGLGPTNGVAPLQLTGFVDPKARQGRFGFNARCEIDETVTVSQPGFADRVTRRKVTIQLDTPAAYLPQDMPVAVAFSPAYTAGAITYRSNSQEATGYGGNATLDLRCGPFTAEYPPVDDMGGR